MLIIDHCLDQILYKLVYHHLNLYYINMIQFQIQQIHLYKVCDILFQIIVNLTNEQIHQHLHLQLYFYVL